ncbi:DNA-directed RNA polymerase subunit alpha [Candidatus Dojkabacteria bacterium]|uniref:DNA-directed RNA polymerase subunit alpha n=1 Tax=Candidatus Dojkabacteria bacterium TaxID=2099670 RepID=A0A955HZ95_9BACT|nr:DNA-directed RNA polymerase subunit alpha [Candidatus Dojkabacteria bacterium]MCB9790783.1 DNA-directed RNA polymerase subunit alpha [Candidatus Nomurabacteria bacterium]
MIQFKDLKVKIKNEEGSRGSYEISPLPRGYGHTLANSLRRIILSSLKGAAITSVKIKGIDHEYSTIEGIKEDVFEIILNLKAIRFKCDSDEPQVCTLEVKGAKDIKASDIKLTGSVQISNADTHIATLTSKTATLSMEIVVESGHGFREAQESERSEVGRIPIDADFCPVLAVSYDVTSARKGQETDLDAVTINIETDGSIKPIDAMLSSASILQDFAGRVMAALGVPIEEVEEMASSSQEIVTEETNDSAGNEVKSWKVDDLPISKRSKSALLSGGFETVEDLAGASATQLLGLPGFGNKCLIEVMDLLNQYGIELMS